MAALSITYDLLLLSLYYLLPITYYFPKLTSPNLLPLIYLLSFPYTSTAVTTYRLCLSAGRANHFS